MALDLGAPARRRIAQLGELSGRWSNVPNAKSMAVWRLVRLLGSTPAKRRLHRARSRHGSNAWQPRAELDTPAGGPSVVTRCPRTEVRLSKHCRDTADQQAGSVRAPVRPCTCQSELVGDSTGYARVLHACVWPSKRRRSVRHGRGVLGYIAGKHPALKHGDQYDVSEAPAFSTHHSGPESCSVAPKPSASVPEGCTSARTRAVC